MVRDLALTPHVKVLWLAVNNVLFKGGGQVRWGDGDCLGSQREPPAEELAARRTTNIRKGAPFETVLTEASGDGEIDVPRDRDRSFGTADR